MNRSNKKLQGKNHWQKKKNVCSTDDNIFTYARGKPEK